MKNNILSIPLAISVFLLLIGYLSRIQHWPYGTEIEQTAYTLIALLYSLRFFGKRIKVHKDTIKFILIIAWCGLSLIASMRFQNIEFILYIVMILGLLWFVLELIDTIKFGIRHTNITLKIGAFTLALEAIFKIQHWPHSSLLHLIGLLIISIGFFIDKHLKKTV